MRNYIVGRNIRVAILLLVALLLTGCALPRPATTVVPPTETLPPIPTLSPTPLEPTATSDPMVALVNGEMISLADFQAELSRYQAAVGTELATEDEQRVLDDLIDQVLLAQAAPEVGFELGGETLQANYSRLVEEAGGEQVFKEWLATNNYTEGSFQHALARSMAAAWMRDQIAEGVPLTIEQVHARQVLLYNLEEAQSVISQLDSGADFETLAGEYDPSAGGDLGWFPRGYLLDPKLDEAAFSLEIDAYSEIIQTQAGFHILQVLERDPGRPLEPGARQALQLRALEDWLAQRRSQSQIQILLP